ncbi:LPS assembly lipoprotein LptE [Congregibacter sp.]|uniref:LPS-assembly lipoprotein LptE n=1 Tax=Congregibacter sp. TaxID=2744308 RepID=UPI00385C99E1
MNNSVPGRLTRSSLVMMLCLVLAGCGFQLRGTGGGSAMPAEWSRMYLASNDPNGELTRIVESTFSASGIVWVPREEAQHILRLGPEMFSQRNLSVNAQARAAEFDLQMSADFMVFDSNRELVMERSTAAVNKQMENDPQNVVGKAEEVRVLQGELRRELAAQILRRISFFAANVE